MKEGIGADATTPLDDGQTPLDPDEAHGLLPNWIATRSDLDVAEEENIVAGIVWAERAIRRQPVLSNVARVHFRGVRSCRATHSVARI